MIVDCLVDVVLPIIHKWQQQPIANLSLTLCFTQTTFFHAYKGDPFLQQRDWQKLILHVQLGWNYILDRPKAEEDCSAALRDTWLAIQLYEILPILLAYN